MCGKCDELKKLGHPPLTLGYLLGHCDDWQIKVNQRPRSNIRLSDQLGEQYIHMSEAAFYEDAAQLSALQKTTMFGKDVFDAFILGSVQKYDGTQVQIMSTRYIDHSQSIDQVRLRVDMRTEGFLTEFLGDLHEKFPKIHFERFFMDNAKEINYKGPFRTGVLKTSEPMMDWFNDLRFACDDPYDFKVQGRTTQQLYSFYSAKQMEERQKATLANISKAMYME